MNLNTLEYTEYKKYACDNISTLYLYYMDSVCA